MKRPIPGPHSNRCPSMSWSSPTRSAGTATSAPASAHPDWARLLGSQLRRVDDWDRWINDRYTRRVQLPLSVAASRIAVLTPYEKVTGR